MDGMNVRCASQISYLRIVATQCHRWGGWRINFEDVTHCDPLEDIMKKTPNLGALRTLQHDGMHCHSDYFTLPFDCATLRPENVILHALFDGNTHPTILLPSHIGSMEVVLDLLRECTRLERFWLVMENWAQNDPVEPGQQPIALEHLTFLDLESSCIPEICELLLLVRAPVLKALHLNHGDIRLMRALAASFSRSGCSLEFLRVPSPTVSTSLTASPPCQNYRSSSFSIRRQSRTGTWSPYLRISC